MHRKTYIFLIAVTFVSCNAPISLNEEIINQSLENGNQASEGYIRSMNFVEGWLSKRDSVSGLIPTNLGVRSDVWEPHNSGADNYPFMVLTAYLLDKNLYNGIMLDMLKTEKKLTSRVHTLPDIYSFSKRDFLSDEIQMEKVMSTINNRSAEKRP